MTPNTNGDWLDEVLSILEGNRIDMPRFEREQIAKQQIQTHEAAATLQAEINQVTEILMLDVPLQELRQQLIRRRHALLALQGEEKSNE